MADAFIDSVEEEQSASNRRVRKIVEVVSDAFAFVRSAEANAALATVTLEELIGDQIKRNGESANSNSNQFTPYDYESGRETPAGDEAPRANFLGGSDTARPTKIDFILAVQNELSAVIEDIKANPPDVVEYSEAVETGFAEEEVTETAEEF
jgi:hypothetical protein